MQQVIDAVLPMVTYMGWDLKDSQLVPYNLHLHDNSNPNIMLQDHDMWITACETTCTMHKHVDFLSDGTGIEYSSTNKCINITTQPLNYTNMYSRRVIYTCIGDVN